MNIETFQRITAGRPQMRAPALGEQVIISQALKRIPSPRLAQIGDAQVKAMMQGAIAVGGGILMLGLSPMNMEITGDRFCARCDVRLTTSPVHHSMLIEGVFDDLGHVEPDTATLLS